MKGTLYGIGVGPGDPGLMTLRAVRAISECGVIALPESGGGRHTALDIAREYVSGKPLLTLALPMTSDAAELARKREEAADLICEKLNKGVSVGFLTLGDPGVYSTYSYLHRLVTERGYDAAVIPGVTSFCAAAAALGIPLCEAGEPLHIVPAMYEDIDAALELSGTKVFMKSGKKLGETLKIIQEKKLPAVLAERVGLCGERLYRDIESVNDAAGYFNVVIVKGSQ